MASFTVTLLTMFDGVSIVRVAHFLSFEIRLILKIHEGPFIFISKDQSFKGAFYENSLNRSSCCLYVKFALVFPGKVASLYRAKYLNKNFRYKKPSTSSFHASKLQI